MGPQDVLRTLDLRTLNYAVHAVGSVAAGTSEVIGRVEDDSDCGAPIDGADVSLASTAGVYTEKTDSDGLFDFRDLPSGNYSLTASKSGLNAADECGGDGVENFTLAKDFTLIEDSYLHPGILAEAADCYTVQTQGSPLPPPSPPRHTSIQAAVLDYVDPSHGDSSARVLHTVEYGPDQAWGAISVFETRGVVGESYLTWGSDGWTVKRTARKLDVSALEATGLLSVIAESIINVLQARVGQ